jgi:predicted transcriptional regulator YdeE
MAPDEPGDLFEIQFPKSKYVFFGEKVHYLKIYIALKRLFSALFSRRGNR